MSKRKLKRQLNLVQVVMLGTAGTIAAEIFVLTGHAAGIAGPASVLAMLLCGLLSYSIALNYCEMATTYPVTGGAMTYVREAWGNNILSYLVGSLDCLSSTFYAALSAVGFAYSLQVFIPSLPIIPVAIVVIAVFSTLNILGVNNVGTAQIILGGFLLTALSIYIIAGLTLPGGFRWETFTSGGSLFVEQGIWPNLVRMLMTIALIYNAYVGFEVIADDAEEIKNPNRNIPLSILISLTLVMTIYVLVALVTLGTIPWQQLVGSETALTDAVRHFLPTPGVPMMAVAGMIATLTSVNTAMLSATREAFTLSRDGAWPRALSRLSNIRTPYVAILAIGVISALVAAIGLVDFLSYISSAGYLFVLFWSNLSMIRLRKRYPAIERPFKAPLFPLTAYLAAGTCILIIAFADRRALLFGAGVIAACAIFYYVAKPLRRLRESRLRAAEAARDRILVPVANPDTARKLVRLASILAQASEDTGVCVLTIVPPSPELPPGLSRNIERRLSARLELREQTLLNHVADYARARNVPIYTKTRAAASISQGILEEAEKRGDVKLILMGWPGPLDAQALPHNPANEVLMAAHTNFAVLLDRGLKEIRHILVPVGGGPHSRLALRLAYEIAEQEDAQVTAMRLFSKSIDEEGIEDEGLRLREIIEDELGSMPERITIMVSQAESVPAGILAETARRPYDLIVVGASEEWAYRTRLFGSVDDAIADQARCSVLLVRRYEPVVMSWLRRQVKIIEHEYERTNGLPVNGAHQSNIPDK